VSLLRYIAVSALFAPFFFGAVAESPMNTAAAKPQEWTLIFSDEFDYTGKLDAQKWEVDTDGGVWGNNEDEHYTDDLRNVRVENGNLVLEAHAEGKNHYTSGRVHMKPDGFKYGKVEVRARFPAGLGSWPAIWMMAVKQVYGNGLWPDNGEIDIGEHAGREPDQLLANIYTHNFNWMNNNGIIKIIDYPGVEQDFHIYTCVWDAEHIELSVDGYVYNVFKNPHTNWGDWPFDQNQRLILDFALGSFGGSEDDTAFPQQMLIDYVRIYQMK
jgi:beta-glucanase (GH16 family)